MLSEGRANVDNIYSLCDGSALKLPFLVCKRLLKLYQAYYGSNWIDLRTSVAAWSEFLSKMEAGST